MNLVQRVYASLESRPLTVTPTLNQSLAPLTSLKAGNKAALWVQVCNRSELEVVMQLVQDIGLPWFVLGKGSNLVCIDHPFKGVLIQLSGDFASITTDQNNLIAGGAALDIKVARYARKAGLSGLEWLVSIPGSIGGAVYMNAGAHHCEIKDLFVESEVFNLELGFLNLSHPEMTFGYRSSRLQTSKEILLTCTFRLKQKNPIQIAEIEHQLLMLRRKNQPVHIKTFGSIFRNPAQGAAWKLIDQVGLRGKTIGNFRISPIHANFIENLGPGDPKGLLELIHLVQTEVFKQTGTHLILEGKLFPPTP